MTSVVRCNSPSSESYDTYTFRLSLLQRSSHLRDYAHSPSTPCMRANSCCDIKSNMEPRVKEKERERELLLLPARPQSERFLAVSRPFSSMRFQLIFPPSEIRRVQVVRSTRLFNLKNKRALNSRLSDIPQSIAVGAHFIRPIVGAHIAPNETIAMNPCPRPSLRPVPLFLHTSSADFRQQRFTKSLAGAHTAS
jgi:hypothetical protein